MGNNTQSRKWLMVINNPHEAQLTHEAIVNILSLFSPAYYCMADEIGGATGTYHTHVYLYSASPIRFSTIKGRFPTAHIERAYGSSKENKAYVQKCNKWELTEKAETSVTNSFIEWGNLPETESEEKNPDYFKLLQDLRDNKSTTEIIESNPKYVFRVREIETLRQTISFDKYVAEKRKLDVVYIFGATGKGKTRGIYERHDPRDICRITNYRSGKGVLFDAYTRQQPVLVFEEYNGQIPIEEMLSYLDIYPLMLPARFTDRVAAYHTVYFTSNQPLEDQYKDVQIRRPETWRAFLRRINKVIEYKDDGTIEEYSLLEDK